MSAIAVALACVLIAWASVAVVAFLLSIAISLEDLPILLRRALRISAPAMWFVPAALFLSPWSALRATIGVLLVANTVRQLVSRMARRTTTHRLRSRSFRLFRDSNVGTGVLSSDSMRAIIGALAMQGGLIAMVARSGFAAAGLFGISTAAWTIASIKGRAYEPGKPPGVRRTLAGVLLTLLLSVGLSVPFLELRAGGASKRGEASLDRPSTVNTGAKVQVAAVPKILLSAKELVPGVILIPTLKNPRPPRIRLPSAHLGFSGTGSLTFPFTGEYHLFPTSSGRLPPGSVVYSGTPFDAIYVTLGGGPLETHGYQKLNPPVDFSNCARVEMTIRNGEDSPGNALVQLILESGVLDLPSDVFGLEPGPEETLSFPMPPPGTRLIVNAIRVAFYRDPTHRAQSTRVAIEQFTLVPRGS